MAGSAPISLRLIRPGPQLLSLPWDRPLAAWDEADVPFVVLPVGPSRHLVRFCTVDGEVLAIKELALWPARREYEALRALRSVSCQPCGPSGFNDLYASGGDPGVPAAPDTLGPWWLEHCFEPAIGRLRAALGEGIDPVQA
jgi:hypothetical protein